MDKENYAIYEKVIITFNPETMTFCIINTAYDVSITVASNVIDAVSAVAIRKAYCDGYYDGMRFGKEIKETIRKEE